MPDVGGGFVVDQAQVQKVAQLASELADAQQALTTATGASRSAEREASQAQTISAALAARAKAARDRATASAAFAATLIRAADSHGLEQDPFVSVLNSPGDLLSKLGAVDRLRSLAGDRAGALRLAASDAAAAHRAAERAKAAAVEARAIDVAGSRQAVAAAQTRVDTVVTALDELPTVLTAGVGWQAITIDPSAIPAGWTLPVRGPLTDRFGPRPSRPAGTALFHPGDDISAACGTTIVAAAAGTVLAAGPNGSYGNFILIDHGGGVETAYGHIRDGGLGVTVGQTVAAGQPIAQVGSTGASTGCHLHLEVRINGVQIDPQPFLAVRGVIVSTR